MKQQLKIEQEHISDPPSLSRLNRRGRRSSQGEMDASAKLAARRWRQEKRAQQSEEEMTVWHRPS